MTICKVCGRERSSCDSIVCFRLGCERERAARKKVEAALRDVLPEAGYPKCSPKCVTVRGANYDEDPRCDCGEGEQRWRFDQARALLDAATAPKERP